ncbi:MAG: hypothetical protein FWB72_06095 [Firmicutes bacterium]|nr:hypothetical protein [Bacillota bacterium]
MFFIILLIPMILALAAENLLWKRNKLKPLDALVANSVWRFVFIVGAFLVVFAFTGVEIFDNFTPSVLLLSLSINAIGAVAVLAWVKTMQFMCVSISEPLSLFRIIPLALLSWLIFGGALSTTEILLIIAMFILCASLGFFQGRFETKCKISPHFARGVLFLLLWVACFVAMDLIVQYATRLELNAFKFSALRATTFVLFCFALVLIVRRGKNLKPIVEALKNTNMILIGLAFAVSSLIFMILLADIGNAGILAALSVASIPLVVLAGVFLMKDRVRWYSYILIAGIVTCVVLLSLYSI